MIEVNSPGIKMNYPLANYSGLGWISETELAAFLADEDGGVTGYYLENDNHFYSLDLPSFVAELDCNGVNDIINDINYTHPSLLPDGQLGLINGCVSRGDPPGLKRQYMVAYNFQTKETNLLVNESLPNYLSNGFTWNPGMTQGLQQIYGGLEGTIYWMSPAGVAPVDFAVNDGERSFSPAKDFPHFSGSDEQGIIFSPAWSPDGKTIAFFATLYAIGRSGFSRSDGEYKIFFMDPIEQKPYPVVGKIYDTFGLTWSPDSKWLAFIGDHGLIRRHGIWLYSIESGKIYPIVSGDFSRIAWSPDGTKISATICEPNHPNILCDRYEIWEYDVNSIT
jgi:WD40-like Beta Propeller Repeat